MRRSAVAFQAGAFTLMFAGDALAHVKWFAPYDLTIPPRPIGEVLTPAFIYMFLLSTACIYAFYWIDRFLYRRHFLAEKLGALVISQDAAYLIMRIATSLLFVSLFCFALVHSSFFLTPELLTDSAIIKWIHLALAAALWFQPTVPIAGAGIFLLYGLAIGEYGIFHMLDYLIFPGMGVYFLLANCKGPGWVQSRYVTLYATTGLTLLWGSIEKWAYPGWTYPLLDADPSLLMGMAPEFYMILAGFVEFNIVFILLSSASVFSRFIALGLNAIFILAIFKFGMIDAIGHLVIMAVLVIMTARGPTSARYFLVLSDKSLWTEAYFMTGLYMLALNVLFISYYGLYFSCISGLGASSPP
jgi:hypothetical protein